MILGCLLLVLGVPISIIATIVFAVKKKKVKIPAICIPVSLVLSLACLIVGSAMYSKTDEYKEASAKAKEEQAAEEKRLEEERLAKEQEKKAKKEKAEKKKVKQEQKKKKKETPKAEEKEEPTSEPTQEAQEVNNEAKSKPEPVPVENSVVLYYMDLYENYEDYDGQYVTISAPISSADEDSVTIKGDIEGVTGMISITLIEARSDLKEGDFITVTGRVDGKAIGCLYMKDANISQTGDGSAQIYNQQKAEYDAAAAQKAEGDVANYKASCETFDYQDVLRNPDSYKDRNCVVSGTVEQIIEGWFGSFTIFVTDANGNKWGCVYSYKDGESRLLEGDGVTMYGKCQGTDTTKTVLGQQVTMPRVDVEYIN